MGHIEAARPASPPSRLDTFLEDAADWCAGRTWWPRALLLLYLVYSGYRLFRDSESSTIFSGITLAIHELGHVIFGFAGHFIGSLMGSGTQLLVPLIVIVLFANQSDYFGMSVGGFWLSFSLFELARYVADARSMELPLVSYAAGEPEHDWNYLLSTLHALPLDHTLALLLRLAAIGIGGSSLAFGIWLLVKMQGEGRKPVQRFR